MIPAFVLATLSLSDAQTAALAHSPVVAQARAAVRERQALVNAASVGNVPHAFANYAQLPQGGNFNNVVTQRLTTAGAQISLSDLAQRDALTGQARGDLRAASADELNAERNERVRTISLYFDAMRTRDVLALRRRIVASEEADLHAAHLRFANGDAPQLDIVRGDVALAEGRAALASAQADADNAVHALAVEIGVDDTQIDLPALASITSQSNVPTSVDVAVALALTQRPEIASAKAAISSEEAAVRIARGARLPGLTAQAGYTTGVDTGIPVSGPNVNVTLDVPLSRAANDRVAAESARLDAARFALDAQEQAINTEVASALRSYRADVDAASAAARARREAEAEVRAIAEGYSAGASSSLDLSDARRTFAEAAVNDTVARATVLEARATLDFLMGTGE
jgi:outer membrane protein TolC